MRMVAAAAGHAWGVDDAADAAASRALRAPSSRTPRAPGGDEASSGSGVRTTRAAVGAGGAVTISAPRGEYAQKDLGVWGREAATLRALALEACAASLHEMAPAGGGDEGDRDRGDLALVRAFNASVHPLHLPTLASLYASPSADVRAAARSLLSNACNACAGRPAHALPAIFRETPSEALRECPKASGLEAWGAFEDAFDDDSFETFFRDSLDVSSKPPRGCVGACVAAAACLANPLPGRTPAPPSWFPRSRADAIVRARSLAGAAASMLGGGVETRVGDRRAGRDFGGGCRARRAIRRRRSRTRVGSNRRDELEPETERYGRHGRHEPEDERPIAARIRRLDRSPFPALPGLSRRFESFAILGRSREEWAGGYPVGTPSAPRRHPRRARDGARRDRLAPLRRRAFKSGILREVSLRADPNRAADVVVARRRPRGARARGEGVPHPSVLAPHVHALMNSVLAALNPANASLRRNCLVAATAVVTELARRLPNVTYHRATSRLAVGIDSPAPSGGTVAIVYDLALAATWRTLVDRDDHPAEEARRFIDGFGAGFGHMWATGSGTSDAGAESPQSEDERGRMVVPVKDQRGGGGPRSGRAAAGRRPAAAAAAARS